MTATIPEQEIEVDFILWEAEDPFDRPCEARRVACPNVGLYRMLWVPFRDWEPNWTACRCGTQVLCLACKDWVIGQEEGLPVYKCGECKGVTTLKGIEPIRGK